MAESSHEPILASTDGQTGEEGDEGKCLFISHQFNLLEFIQVCSHRHELA